MPITYKITLLSLIFITIGLSSNCTFTIDNTSLLTSNNGDMLTVYLDAFVQNNLQSSLDIFTIQVSHTGSDCANPPYSIEYSIKIYSPEIGLNQYEPFYVGESPLDTTLTNQIYYSSDFNLVSGPTTQVEKLISYISQSGKLPNGKYLFQFDIKDNIQVLSTYAESIDIDRPVSLELLSPGGALSELTHSYTYSSVPLFTWYSDFCSQCSYGIRICEYNLDEHSSMQHALDDWSILPYDQSDAYYTIPWSTYSFQYPTEGHIDLEVGKYYVWQIRRSYATTLIPHDDYSPIYIFEVRSLTKKQLDFTDPYLSAIQSLLGTEQFNLWFSTGGSLERFVTAGESIWIDGEELHIDVLYTLVSELHQGKITLENFILDDE